MTMNVQNTKIKTETKQEKVRRFVVKPKVCTFCTEKVVVDYKDIGRLRRFISDRGKIEPRRRTGTCAKHQRQVALAIKRARFLALLPDAPHHLIPKDSRSGENNKSNGEMKNAETDISTKDSSSTA